MDREEVSRHLFSPFPAFRQFLLRAGVVALALATCLRAETAAPAAPVEVVPDSIREIRLREARADAVRAEVERALEGTLGARVRQVSLGLSEPRLLRRGEDFELRFESGEIHLSEMDVGGIKVTGSIRFEDLRLDYAALGVGQFRLLSDPKVYPDLSTSLTDLEVFMQKQGLRETFLRHDQETGDLIFGGRRPVRILLVRVNPLVTVRGRFVLADNKVGFHLSRIDVEDAGGAVAEAVERRVRSLAAQTVDLDEVLSGLRIRSVRVGGGRVRVVSEAGLLLAQDLTSEAAGAG